jgi:hypothetical protein
MLVSHVRRGAGEFGSARESSGVRGSARECAGVFIFTRLSYTYYHEAAKNAPILPKW